MLKRSRVEEVFTDDEADSNQEHRAGPSSLTKRSKVAADVSDDGLQDGPPRREAQVPANAALPTTRTSRAPLHGEENASRVYQIGWICALPIELAAAKAMLDEVHEPFSDQDANDNNTYILGRIGKHNIAIACLPAGQYGTTSSATVAKDMLRTFSASLKFGLMVGIGGGIPSADNDIRLGDVVISQPTGTHGGVVQHDIGRLQEGGKLERTGSLNAPPRPLLTALASLKAEHLVNDPDYHSFIDNAVKKSNRAANSFRRPPTASDKYYQTVATDQLQGPPVSPGADELVARPDREDPMPETFYGTIASGNVVVKDGSTRDKIGQELGAMCFEMEAVGLMQDFPCLVIRDAIRDELRGITAELREGRAQQANWHDEHKAKSWNDEITSCHQAFKSSNYRQFKDINPSRAKGTCRWVLDHPSFRSWSEAQQGRVLWVTADPGCGKSVLSRSLVDGELRAFCGPDVNICYFFFKDNDQQDRLEIALAALLHQLYEQIPELIEAALPRWRSNGTKLLQESGMLWDIFMESCATASSTGYTIVCVLDALDECRSDDRHKLIELLAGLPLPLRILCTSRPYRDINQKFQSLISHYGVVRLEGEHEGEAISHEIDLVIHVRMEQLQRDHQLSESLAAYLVDRLRSVEHRTYLWLHLVLADIESRLGERLHPDVLDFAMIPESVEMAYERILSKVSISRIAQVRLVFSIILSARRPISVTEMGCALGMAASTSPNRSSACFMSEAWVKNNIRFWCGLFVFISNGHLYLLHQTAKDFLLATDTSTINSSSWKRSFQPSDAHRAVALFCMHFLLLEDIMLYSEKDDSVLYDLFHYASTKWIEHFSEVILEPDDSVLGDITALYAPGRYGNMLWARKYLFSRTDVDSDILGTWDHFPDCMPRAHVAALATHLHLLGPMHKFDFDLRLGGHTALQIAYRTGNVESIRTLLDAGIDWLTDPESLELSVKIAVEHKRPQALKTILDSFNANVSRLFERYTGSLLHFAAKRHSIDCMKYLVSAGHVIIEEAEASSQPLCAVIVYHASLEAFTALIEADKHARRNAFNDSTLWKPKHDILAYLSENICDETIASVVGLFLTYCEVDVAAWHSEALYLAVVHNNWSMMRMVMERDRGRKNIPLWTYYSCWKAARRKPAVEPGKANPIMDTLRELVATLDLFDDFDPTVLTREERFRWAVPEHVAVRGWSVHGSVSK